MIDQGGKNIIPWIDQTSPEHKIENESSIESLCGGHTELQC